jgi:aspartyl-tRNA(Asn)/glutamyl-tRNA(Gln) amidotransferase subunit A
MSTDLCFMPATELVARYAAKTLSPIEVTRAVLDRIRLLNPKLNAYCLVDEDGALAAARASEARWRKGEPAGPVDGVPASIKDLVLAKNWPTLRGSKTVDAAGPWNDDAPTTARLREGGAVLLGKTCTPEFGWKGVTDSALTGITRNPWNLERTPGGSSGGASAAVAAGMGPLAIGTDGGGSIRIPASLAGIYGIKPTFGLVPIYPFSAAWGLSHIGPMTRTVADAALMLNAAAGPDARDPFSLPSLRVDYVKALKGGVKGLRVAWTADLGFARAVDPEVKAACERAARRFRELGCRVEEVTPKWPSPQAAWRTMFLGGIAARLGPALRDRRDDIDPGLVAIADETRSWSPTQFVQAWFDRLAWEEHPRRLFERYDLLLTPTIACAAFKVGLDGPSEIAGTATGIYDWIPFTYPFNMTGHPGASVPCGFTSDKLPIGLQILGRRFEDATVLRASAAFEKIAPWAHLRPPE